MSPPDVADATEYSNPPVAHGRSDADSRETLSREWMQLSAFQRDCLTVISRFDGDPYGLEIKAALGRLYAEEVNHGRMYPNLDELTEAGYLRKFAKDDRTNGYALTSRGAAVVAVGGDLLDDARSTPRWVDVDTVLGSDLYE